MANADGTDKTHVKFNPSSYWGTVRSLEYSVDAKRFMSTSLIMPLAAMCRKIRPREPTTRSVSKSQKVFTSKSAPGRCSWIRGKTYSIVEHRT